MFEFLQDLWSFMRVRKKFWLMPVLITTALLGAILMLAEGAGAVAPFIYTLF